MAEYVDKEKAMMVHEPPKNQRYYQTDNLDDAYGQGWDDALNAIGKLPTSNVKEIVCAHWEKADGMGYYRCSHCKIVDDKYYQPEYCPHCGAEMSEVQND